MIWGTSIAILLVLGLWKWRNWTSIHFLNCVKQNLSESLDTLPSNVKILDVRDMAYFNEAHIQGSINISLGRLPFVWQKELIPDDEVVILSDGCLQSKKAARILKRRGFNKLYIFNSPVNKLI
ncbi:rhodanese-like domain-containing protein [Paenibacillus sp. KACC 21273]|uniref:rhodanese-like domain-containing protein n=1 Tax=Paenibacillus sp. KACC 21273 TaxID=3025665 RepID=UPI0023659011|nr:rhodanese-like domain-containing protein [Paenibacillus sp. KACC 21273]WDF48855.1 rhodanese-like domain-containing protein [Paenibacillus sp. KACC 21273]